MLVLLLLSWPAPALAASWTWPVAGPREVSRPFAPPETRYASGHRGADLPAVPGAVVRAAGAGRVSYAGLLAGRGVVVVVHGDLRTTYEPVVASVAVGDVVAAGAPLGTLSAGHAGCPVSACLHWGLRRGDTYLDPVRLVEAGPVRLLPLGSGSGGSSRSGLGGPPAGPSVGPAGPPAPRTGAVATGAVTGAALGVGGLGSGASAGPGRAPGDLVPVAAVTDDRDLPLGITAVAALVLGVGLLVRGRPAPPPRPPTASAAPARSVSPDEPDLGAHADVLDLAVERLRRRAG